MEFTEFTLEDCTRLWEIGTSGCCGREGVKHTRVRRCCCCFHVDFDSLSDAACKTHMPPEDPVQQAASGWLWWLIPVQIWRSGPVRPKHIQIFETLRFNHLKKTRAQKRWSSMVSHLITSCKHECSLTSKMLPTINNVINKDPAGRDTLNSPKQK